MAETTTEIREFAQDLFEAIEIAESGDFDATCSSANFVLSLFFPGAERYQGTFDGEDHEWAMVDGQYLDVTASQFGGQDILLSSDLPAEYEGEEVSMSEVVRGCADVDQIVAILEERGWEQL
jgi:hypothetical protein